MEKLLVAALTVLVLASPATAALGPEAHPSCHCKAKVRKHEKPWDYWTIVDVTDSDGNVTHRRARCHVDHKGRTSCAVTVG